MRSHRSFQRSAANVLVVTLFITAAMGIVLISCLSMISTQRNMTARSEAWNRALVLAENGIEEGLAHLNRNASSNGTLASQGWTLAGGKYSVRRDFSEGYVEVSIQSIANPVITSTGYVPLSAAYVSGGGPLLAAANSQTTGAKYITRSVEAKCNAKGAFTKAITARDKIELNGKNVITDSFHSFDPQASTNDGSGVAWGQYDATKRRDRGDLAVINGLSDEIEVSKAEVRGHVSTGPNGDINLKGGAAVGSSQWIDGGNTGIQPGWSANDANFTLPSVTLPFTTGLPPLSGTVNGEFYDMILDTGDYVVGNLKGNVLVRGNARILATGDVKFNDDPKKGEGIDIVNGGRLEVYIDCKKAEFTGKKNKKQPASLRMGLNAGGTATNLFVYGTAKCTEMEFKNMDTFTGVVYAPDAKVTLKAGSPKYYHCDFFGAISGLSVKLEKNATFHYDENTGEVPGTRVFTITSWREL